MFNVICLHKPQLSVYGVSKSNAQKVAKLIANASGFVPEYLGKRKVYFGPGVHVQKAA